MSRKKIEPKIEAIEIDPVKCANLSPNDPERQLLDEMLNQLIENPGDIIVHRTVYNHHKNVGVKLKDFTMDFYTQGGKLAKYFRQEDGLGTRKERVTYEFTRKNGVRCTVKLLATIKFDPDKHQFSIINPGETSLGKGGFGKVKESIPYYPAYRAYSLGDTYSSVTKTMDPKRYQDEIQKFQVKEQKIQDDAEREKNAVYKAEHKKVSKQKYTEIVGQWKKTHEKFFKKIQTINESSLLPDKKKEQIKIIEIEREKEWKTIISPHENLYGMKLEPMLKKVAGYKAKDSIKNDQNFQKKLGEISRQIDENTQEELKILADRREKFINTQQKKIEKEAQLVGQHMKGSSYASSYQSLFEEDVRKQVITMPKAEEISVEEFLKSPNSIKNFTDCLKMMIAIGKAANRVHEGGHVHHDLKPENVFYDKELNEATLIDFGAAEQIGHKEGASAGTTQYQHPDQTDFSKLARQPDLATSHPVHDCYAVGVIFEKILLTWSKAAHNQFFTIKKGLDAGLDQGKIIDRNYAYLEKCLEKKLEFSPNIATKIVSVLEKFNKAVLNNNRDPNLLNNLINTLEGELSNILEPKILGPKIHEAVSEKNPGKFWNDIITYIKENPNSWGATHASELIKVIIMTVGTQEQKLMINSASTQRKYEENNNYMLGPNITSRVSPQQKLFFQGKFIKAYKEHYKSEKHKQGNNQQLPTKKEFDSSSYKEKFRRITFDGNTMDNQGKTAAGLLKRNT